MTDTPPQNPDNQDYQGPGTAAESATIYHAEIDPAFQELSLQNLLSALKGNGIKAEDVQVTKFEGETLEYIAVTILRLKTKVSDKRQAGKVTGPMVLGSAQQIHEAITKEEHKITHSQDVIKRIKDVILERPDKGFGVENEFIKLPFLHKDFVVYEPCNPCRSQGKMPCNRCAGKGSETCPRCNGSGNQVCPDCSGRQFLSGPNGEKRNCMRCNATGREQCSSCNGQRQIQCQTCKGTRTMTCGQCNGHAWISHIHMAEIDAFIDYDYDREKLSERVIEQIDRLGPELPEHVQIAPIIMGREQERDEIALPYQVRVPHADVIFKIKSMEVGAYMFGTRGMLLKMPYFLEKIMGPGIKQLKAAGAGKGNVAENLQKAGRYKTLRQIILASSKLGPEKALHAVLDKNPIGISEDVTRKLIILADRAMRLITKKPRQIGTAIGIILAGGLFGGYFHALRQIAVTSIPPLPMIYNVIDALVLIIGSWIAVLTIQIIAASAMKKALAGLMKNTTQKTGRIKAGKQAYWAILGSLIAFLGAAYSTLHTSAPSPSWVIELAKFIQ